MAMTCSSGTMLRALIQTLGTGVDLGMQSVGRGLHCRLQDREHCDIVCTDKFEGEGP